jgi:hypothetical protein
MLAETAEILLQVACVEERKSPQSRKMARAKKQRKEEEKTRLCTGIYSTYLT